MRAFSFAISCVYMLLICIQNESFYCSYFLLKYTSKNPTHKQITKGNGIFREFPIFALKTLEHTTYFWLSYIIILTILKYLTIRLK